MYSVLLLEQSAIPIPTLGGHVAIPVVSDESWFFLLLKRWLPLALQVVSQRQEWRASQPLSKG